MRFSLSLDRFLLMISRAVGEEVVAVRNKVGMVVVFVVILGSVFFCLSCLDI